MKQRTIMLVLVSFLTSNLAIAQENVKKAFETFVNSKNVEVSKSFSEERDFTKANRPLVAKADVYTFTIKKKHRKLIDEVLTAFDKDRNNPNIYQILTHTGGRGVPTNARDLLVGNERNNVVQIGMNEMQSWYLMCLLDPEDKTHSHRYAYAIEWNDDPKQIQLSGKIRGKIVVTYSVIPQEVLNNYQIQYEGSVKYEKDDSDNMNMKIAKEVSKMGLKGDFSELANSSQFLIAFEALKTEFLKGNATTQQGATLPMTIYSLCSYMRPLIDKDKDLRAKLIDDLNKMIDRCDKTSDLGISHIAYLRLAIKRLE